MNSQSLSGKTVLIAEDDKDLLGLMVSVMLDSGAEVSGAENGKNAFEILKMKKFDVLITDLHMPDGDGITLIKNINSELMLKPKIFICSAFNDIDPASYRELGIVASFTKPFNRKSMIEAILAAF